MNHLIKKYAIKLLCRKCFNLSVMIVRMLLFEQKVQGPV